MIDQAQYHELRDALATAVSEQTGAARYQRYQREMRGGRASARVGAHPREFDAEGFPIPQRSGSFLERVARLLNAP